MGGEGGIRDLSVTSVAWGRYGGTWAMVLLGLWYLNAGKYSSKYLKMCGVLHILRKFFTKGVRDYQENIKGMAIIAKAVIMVNKQAGTLKRKRQRILIGMDMIVVMMNPTINHCRDNPMILILFLFKRSCSNSFS